MTEKRQPTKKATKDQKKLELNKETVQELNDEQLGEVAGGIVQPYNSNGCGTAFSYAGQETCNPDPKNTPSYFRCPTTQDPLRG
jgi:hypothetical protein